MSRVLSLLGVVLPFVLDHPLWPVDPGFENTPRHLLVDSSHRIQEVLPALTIVNRWFSFDLSKEENALKTRAEL
jgi:hypothetical protein